MLEKNERESIEYFLKIMLEYKHLVEKIEKGEKAGLDTKEHLEYWKGRINGEIKDSSF